MQPLAIIQNVDAWGLLDMVYTTARRHFMDEIVAKPARKRVPQLHVPEMAVLPTEEERIAEMTFEFAMGRVANDGSDDSGSLN